MIVEVPFLRILINEIMLVQKPGLGTIEYRKQFRFVQGFADGFIKTGLYPKVVRNTQKISITDMKRANIIFERAFLRLVNIVSPHNSLQWGSLLIYKELLVIYHALKTISGTKLL